LPFVFIVYVPVKAALTDAVQVSDTTMLNEVIKPATNNFLCLQIFLQLLSTDCKNEKNPAVRRGFYKFLKLLLID